MSFDDLMVEGEAFLLANPLADGERLRKYLMRFETDRVTDEHIRDTAGVAGLFGGLTAMLAAIPLMLFYGDSRRKAYEAKVDRAVRILMKRRKRRADRG
jgi:hypothetical protein